MKNSMIILGILLVVAGCSGKQDIDKISEAQACLDKAGPTTALACMEKVDGLESQAAYLIRCGATFTRQGFGSPSTLASVANQLTSTSVSAGDSFNVLTLVAFTANGTTITDIPQQTANYNDSTTNFSYCKLASSPGLLFLSAISRIGTAVIKSGADNNGVGFCNTGGAMADRLACIVASPTLHDGLGDVIATTYQQNCTNSSASSPVFCSQFKTAIDNSNGTNSDIFCEFLGVYLGAAPC